jgi:hypothetical protein
MTDTKTPEGVVLVRAPQYSWKGYGITSAIIVVIAAPIMTAVFLNEKDLHWTAAVGLAFLVAIVNGLIYGAVVYFPVTWIRTSMFRAEKTSGAPN